MHGPSRLCQNRLNIVRKLDLERAFFSTVSCPFHVQERGTLDNEFWMKTKIKLLRFHHNGLCPDIFEMKTPQSSSHFNDSF